MVMEGYIQGPGKILKRLTGTVNHLLLLRTAPLNCVTHCDDSFRAGRCLLIALSYLNEQFLQQVSTVACVLRWHNREIRGFIYSTNAG